jgi:hypothetical protein
MGLESAFQRLHAELTRLRDALSDLRVTIMEDCPLNNNVSMVDHFENSVTDLLGLVEEAMNAIGSAAQAQGTLGRAEAARNSLLLTHRRLHRLAQDYRNKLAAYDNIYLLRQLGRERGGEWRSWCSVVKEGIERCVLPLDAVHEAIQECWEEGTDSMVFAGVMSQAPVRIQPGDSTQAIKASKGRQDSWR